VRISLTYPERLVTASADFSVRAAPMMGEEELTASAGNEMTTAGFQTRRHGSTVRV
jgi:hypothetical protein